MRSYELISSHHPYSSHQRFALLAGAEVNHSNVEHQ